METTIKNVKKGDFIRLRNTDTAPVWIRGDFERISKTYTLISYNDSCKWIFRKGTTKCFVDFDF